MRTQKGFTLVELLVTVAITGVIVSVLGAAIHQLVTTAEYGEARLTAHHELQNAAYWFNLDGQMAVSAAGGASLTYTLPPAQTVSYSLTGQSLRRTSGGSTITLAQNVTSASFSVSGYLVTMNLTSAPPGRTGVSEQGTYRVNMRAAP